MDGDRQPRDHITIRKGLSLPPLEKCMRCCFPGLYHCPFCSPSIYKPTKRSKVMHHMNIHLRRACYIGEYVVHRCGLSCRTKLHFHCLYCPATLIRKRDFIIHVPFCQEAHKKNPKISTQQAEELQMDGLTPGKSITPTYHIDDSDDSDSDEMTTILESQDESSLEGSSSRSVTHFVSRSSSDGDAVRRIAQPDSSKCDQMVQTSLEKPGDCDEYYFMNLVKVFKRLTPRKKAEVRMKMERILFEAELE